MEDYIEDDFLEEENSSSRRPFLIAVGVLVSLFILMGACTAFFLVNNRAAQRNEQVAAIETRNAETEASNVATRVSLTETAAAMPTDTPEPTAAPTDTPQPNTPTPTNTPVIDDKANDNTIGTVDDGTTEVINSNEDASNGSDAAGEEDNSNAADGKDDENATPTPISALSETGDGSGDALPQTGLDSWGVIVAAFVLIGLLIFARRLRAAG